MEEQDDSPDGSGPYVVAHMFLLCCVIMQATIWIQLSHVSRQRYHPFGKIFTFNFVAMLISVIVISALQATKEDMLVDTKTNGLILLGVTCFF